MEDISKIIQGEGIIPGKSAIPPYDRRRPKKRRYFHEAKNYFHELTKIVEEVHKELLIKDSPFRLCIYQQGDDIFIDIVTIDSFGKISQIFKHDISHEELDDLVQQIKTGRGLILDADA